MMYRFLSSFKTTFVSLLILAIGAALGTFIENDFGSTVAKEMVYHNLWYHLIFLLASVNLILIFIKKKMYKVIAGGIFHLAFIIILFGAIITHHFGIDGLMHIREGEKSNSITIGDKDIEIPFSIALNKFTLTRYPGSRSPSEFVSEVSVIAANKETLDAQIFMNNTLVYGGYKFFQTSYDPDEKGTILSVNKDPGVEITYIGYALLFLGLIVTLFDKKSRFQHLIRKIKEMPIASLLLPLLLLTLESNAQEYSSYIEDYLKGHKENSKELSSAFGALVVQGPDGRMKPLDTQNREVLSKFTGKSAWQGMDANQVILGMFSRPDIWKKVNIIKVKTPRLRKILGVSEKQKLVRFADFFDTLGNYKLTKEVERANLLAPSTRGTFERDIIKVDERLNITFMAYRGVLLTIFPIPNDKTNKWVDFKTIMTSPENKEITYSLSELLEKLYNRSYENSFKHIKDIQKYQNEFGSTIIPNQAKLDTEISFNKTRLFIKLSGFYILFGLFLLIYGLTSIFYNKLINPKVKTIFIIGAIILLVFHSYGLAIRWYISGYTPITSTYETMIFIGYSAIFAGVIFFRKSTIALAASSFMAGIFLFAAYLGEIDPEITSLVPVLKSYWLSIHVSVITASYGFFGISAILGMTNLVLFSLKNKERLHIEAHIKTINYINEVSLILGLVLLVIGNFIGGIWANESWGRYWGWDPKETWAYISILVYTLVIHARLIKQIYSHYLFAILSTVSFFSILMTYFGVNFYLSGLHSYATGEPLPIPTWVYYLIAIVMLLIGLSFKKRKLSSLE